MEWKETILEANEDRRCQVKTLWITQYSIKY